MSNDYSLSLSGQNSDCAYSMMCWATTAASSFCDELLVHIKQTLNMTILKSYAANLTVIGQYCLEDKDKDGLMHAIAPNNTAHILEKQSYQIHLKSYNETAVWKNMTGVCYAFTNQYIALINGECEKEKAHFAEFDHIIALTVGALIVLFVGGMAYHSNPEWCSGLFKRLTCRSNEAVEVELENPYAEVVSGDKIPSYSFSSSATRD